LIEGLLTRNECRRVLDGHRAFTLPLLPRPSLQKVIDYIRHKLAQGAPLGIGNPLKLSFRFSAMP
jgi:hypothetical protein